MGSQGVWRQDGAIFISGRRSLMRVIPGPSEARNPEPTIKLDPAHPVVGSGFSLRKSDVSDLRHL